jgi:FkbM family methyltransferase
MKDGWLFKQIASWVRGSRFEVGLRELRRDIIFSPMTAQDIRDNERMKSNYAYLLRSSSNCVDIGAHIGTYLEIFLHLAPNGQHIAIEPLPHLANRLRELFPTIKIHQTALSNCVGSAEFFYVKGLEGWSGLRESNYPQQVQKERLQVTVTTLDKLLPSDYRPDLIKVDVEGAELQLFQGAIETLHKHRPYLVFEHFVDAYRSFGITPNDIWDVLVGQLKYRIFTIDGRGPLSINFFYELAETRTCWNFIAHD